MQICEEDNNALQINWEKAEPVLNTNFFHIDNLIKESGKYRKLLRPWELYSGLHPETELKLHQYYFATKNKGEYNIAMGDWVGRVKKTQPSGTYLKDCLVLTQSAQKYVYDSKSRTFVLNSVRGVPCIIRPTLWGLTAIHKVSLTQAKLIDNIWEYNCTQDNLALMFLNTDGTPLAFENDAIMGRVFIKDGENNENRYLIAHVPVTIRRKWNPQIIKYEFALQFPDLNFPPEAEVEFW